MRGFVEHIESCENCHNLDEAAPVDWMAQQYECFKDDMADRADRAYDEWRDSQAERNSE